MLVWQLLNLLDLFPQSRSPLCCVGSVSSTINVEDNFSSKGGE
jgi:hypothetical protein